MSVTGHKGDGLVVGAALAFAGAGFGGAALALLFPAIPGGPLAAFAGWQLALAAMARKSAAPRGILLGLVLLLAALSAGAVVAAFGGPATGAISLAAIPVVAWSFVVRGGARPAALGALVLVAAALAPSAHAGTLLSSGGAPVGVLALVAFAFVSAALAAGLEAERCRAERREASLKNAASTDPLTGLWNRRPLEEALEQTLQGAVVIFDLDHFKRVNDAHGHGVGDEVLCAVSRRLSGTLRGADRLVRLGGEEFVAVLSGVDVAQAQMVAERARKAVAASPIEFTGGAIAITVSAGVAPIDGDARRALGHADAALYRAKESGRDRVELAAAWRTSAR